MVFKGHCVYTNWILFSHQKGGNLAIWQYVNGPWEHYAKWNKSEKDK